MAETSCEHRALEQKFDVPIDVKSLRATEFGSVFECKACGLGLVQPLPDASQIEAHYDLPVYYTHGEGHLREVEPRLVDRVMEHLAWRVDRGKGFDPAEVAPRLGQSATALDIGCGAGGLLTEMKALGIETFGIDPDPNARAEAARNGHAVFAGTAEHLPKDLMSGNFDLITMTHVLEHCLDPVRALANARRLLVEDGLFYCEVPNAGSVYFERYGQISEMLDVPRHLYFFRKENLEDIAGAAGLEIVSWRFHGLTRHFNPGWKKWENSIYDRLVETGVKPSCRRRSIAGDVMLLGSALFRPRERRYDCIGFLAMRSDRPARS